MYLICVCVYYFEVYHTDKNYFSNDLIVQEIDGIKIYLNNLMKIFSENVLNDIRKFFQDNVDGSLDEKQLQKVLELYQIKLPDEDFRPLFAKIDVRKEGTVTFSQFVTYLGSEFEIKRSRYNVDKKKLDKLIPAVLPRKPIDENAGNRVSKITGIAFRPIVDPNTRQVLLDESEYVVANESGKIYFYTSDLTRKNTHSLNKKVIAPHYIQHFDFTYVTLIVTISFTPALLFTSYTFLKSYKVFKYT